MEEKKKSEDEEEENSLRASYRTHIRMSRAREEYIAQLKDQKKRKVLKYTVMTRRLAFLMPLDEFIAGHHLST